MCVQESRWWRKHTASGAGPPGSTLGHRKDQDPPMSEGIPPPTHTHMCTHTCVCMCTQVHTRACTHTRAQTKSFPICSFNNECLFWTMQQGSAPPRAQAVSSITGKCSHHGLTMQRSREQRTGHPSSLHLPNPKCVDPRGRS